MIRFDITRLVPKFILNDKNGYAIAKAIEAALTIFCETIQRGVSIIEDVDAMPEWRLDEMAWELNCMYDYTADIENKRKWIRSAQPLFAAYGTVQAIYDFLEGMFDEVEVEEFWQYDADPYHFRVTVSGEWTEAKENWVRRAVAASKNVRSVLDSIAIGSGTTITVHGEGGVVARFQYPMTRPDLLAGTLPQVNTIGKLTDSHIEIATDARAHVFPYPMTGTNPDVNTVGAMADAEIDVAPDAAGRVFPYPMTAPDQMAGRIPQENTVAAMVDDKIQAAPEAKGTVFSYEPASEDKYCGEDKI